MAKILKEVTGPFLLILSGKLENVILATRNIPSLALIQAKSLNAYEVLKAEKILITREAIKTLEAKWTKD